MRWRGDVIAELDTIGRNKADSAMLPREGYL